MFTLIDLTIPGLTAQLADAIEVERHTDATSCMSSSSCIAHGRAGQVASGTTTSLRPELCSLSVLANAITLERATLRIGVGAIDLPEVHIVD